MHLHHTSLSLNGKKKGKTKFRNAEEAKKSRENQKEWDDLLKKWGCSPNEKKKTTMVKLPTQPSVYYRDTGPRISSKNGGLDMSPALASPAKVYTGTKVKGIGTMHKSNAVPIFSDEEAQDIARMRR
jgi:hypothetical protein